MGKKHQDQSKSSNTDSEQPKPVARRIYLFGRLENDVTLPTIKRLLRMNDQDPSAEIDLFINSSGGNGYNADAIISVMHSISAKVNTICLGHALSGACEILASGTGRRCAYEFATLMFHQTLWEADGDITNLEIQAAQGQRFREAQIEMLTRCTGQSKEKIRKDIERDYYLSAGEALTYGLIDEIIFYASDHGNGSAKVKLSNTAADSDNKPAEVDSGAPSRSVRRKGDSRRT